MYDDFGSNSLPESEAWGLMSSGTSHGGVSGGIFLASPQALYQALHGTFALVFVLV